MPPKGKTFKKRREANSPKVDTGLKSGIYYEASLITAVTGRTGRIIKNLQPISMGV